MARLLTWQALSREQIAALRAPKAGEAPRALLAAFLLQPAAAVDDGAGGGALDADVGASSSSASASSSSSSGDAQLRREIVLDLFSYALKQGQAWGFDDEKLSVLVGLVKAVHEASVGQRLTIERSFAFFKDSLLNHSVHRPPFSCGVFSQPDMRAVLDWMLHTYYAHYKLYQYAFTRRVTLSLTTFHPSSLVEVPPAIAPLATALTEEQQQRALLDEQQRQLEEERSRVAEAAAAAEEAAAAALAAEYEASLPDDVKAKVAAALEREVAFLRTQMEQQFQQQQGPLLAKIAQLEAALAASAGKPQPAAAGSTPASARGSA